MFFVHLVTRSSRQVSCSNPRDQPWQSDATKHGLGTRHRTWSRPGWDTRTNQSLHPSQEQRARVLEAQIENHIDVPHSMQCCQLSHTVIIVQTLKYIKSLPRSVKYPRFMLWNSDLVHYMTDPLVKKLKQIVWIANHWIAAGMHCCEQLAQQYHCSGVGTV